MYPGYTVPSFYDPMISKLSVWGPTRREAIARMKRALSEYVVKGITTNIRYLLAIMDAPEFFLITPFRSFSDLRMIVPGGSASGWCSLAAKSK